MRGSSIGPRGAAQSANDAAVKQRVEFGRGVVGPCATPDVLGESPEREYREVFRSHNVVVEPRAPQLDKGRMLPSCRAGTLHSRVDR